MKKSLVALSLVIVFLFANTLFAAAGNFSDIPLGHWSYDAVSQLAQAGMIEETPRNGKILTRYEMSLLVANALTKAEKAEAGTRAVLDRLATEFARELNDLGVTVKAQKDSGDYGLKVSGLARIRHEWTKNPRALAPLDPDYYTGKPTEKSEIRALLYVILDKKFDENNYFHAIIGNESIAGDASTDSPSQFFEGYYASKNRNFEWAAGRFTPTIGKGLLFSAPYLDGGRVSFGKAVKTTVIAGKKTDFSWLLTDSQVKLNKNTNMLVAYTADKHKQYYDSKAVGFEYTGIPALKLQSEYGVNTADRAKAANGGNSPRGMYLKAQYKGANPLSIGSTGAWIGFRKGDNGFDALQYTGAGTAPNNWTYPAQGSSVNDVKGFDYGFEMTVAPQAMLQIMYGDLQAVKVAGNVDKKDQSFLVTQLTWLF